MRRILVCSVLVFLCACGGKAKSDGTTQGTYTPNNVTLVAPSTPRGTVSGQIMTAELTGLAGANVSVSVGEPASDVGGTWSATTDSTGSFSITSLPAGSLAGVTVSASGYATLHTKVFIPVAAGNFPIDNGNVAVGPLLTTALTQKLDLLVLDHNGVPVQKASVIVEATPAGSDLSQGSGTYGASFGGVVQSTTTDTNGNASAGNLPASDELSRLGGFYTVSIPAVLDSNNNPISGGKVVTYSGQSIMLDPSVRVIQLPDPRTPGALTIVASNAQSLISADQPLQNLLHVTDPIYVVFSQAVQQPSFLNVLTDEYGVNKLAFTPTFSANGNVVTLQPTLSLVQGQEFNLSVRADSIDNGSSVYQRGFFFAGDPAAPQTFSMATNGPNAGTPVQWTDVGMPGNGLLDPGETVHCYFNQAVGWVGTASNLYAFINDDLNMSGKIGDATGEVGFPIGFPMQTEEPTTETGYLFPLSLSNYTTRWNFVYAPGLLYKQVQASTLVTIAFSKVANSAGGVQNVWGQQIVNDTMAEPVSRAQ